MESLPEDSPAAAEGPLTANPITLEDLKALAEAEAEAGKPVLSLCLTSARDAFVKSRSAEAAIVAIRCLAPHLTALDATSCATLTPEHLRAILEPATALTQLKLSYVRGVNGDVLLAVAALHGLTALELEGCVLDCAGVALLHQLPRLARLSLARTPVSDACMGTVASITSLTHLSLAACKEVTDAGVAELAALSYLKELSLESCPCVSEAGVAKLSGLRELRSLDVSGCEALSTLPTQLPTCLTTLRLRGCKQLQDESLTALAPCSALRELDLSVCPDISDGGLTHLSRLSSLTSLNLNMCRRVGDPGVRAIAGLPNLTDVNLGWCVNVTAEGVAALKKDGQHVNVRERTGKSMKFEKFQVPPGQ